MNKIQRFTDLDVWRESHNLTLLVYRNSDNFPRSEILGLQSQIRRASVSIESCIAEGFSRFTYKERISFYLISRGSLAEVQTQALIAKDLNYWNQKVYMEIFEKSETVAALLGGLIRSTRKLSG